MCSITNVCHRLSDLVFFQSLWFARPILSQMCQKLISILVITCGHTVYHANIILLLIIHESPDK